MALPLGIMNLGPVEIIVILIIGLLLFGSRLPEVGRSLGRGLMEFKRGLAGMRDEMDDVDREADRRVDEELEKRRTRELQGGSGGDEGPGNPPGSSTASGEEEPRGKPHESSAASREEGAGERPSEGGTGTGEQQTREEAAAPRREEAPDTGRIPRDGAGGPGS